MKKIFLLVILITSFLYSQSEPQIMVAEAIPSANHTDWGIDNILLNNEPIGGFSGIQKSDGTIYVAVNDTLSTANLGLVVFFSTDDGETWSMHPTGITYRGFYQKVKMIRSGLDSIYCSFQIGTQIFTWNPISGNFAEFWNGNYRDYDITASSTGNLYIFADSLPNNSLTRYGSTNGGTNWIGRGNVSSAAAHPKIFMSGTGDTLILNYYGPILSDTATSVIRSARYRESGPGTMAVAGTFSNVASELDYKREFKSVMNNNEVWFIYTLGPDGSRDIMARNSTDNGTSFTTAVPIAGNPNTDEYGLDAGYFSLTGSTGFDVIYFSDSAGTANDRLYHITVDNGSTIFSDPELISEHTPIPSANYSNSIVPMHYSAADVGALWVGDDAGTNKLFWDQLSAIIPVELTSFTAAINGNNVSLSWITATETNNLGFDLERSIQPEDWEKIGFVPGSGTTTERKSYSFNDENLAAGTYLYRIKQIDFDGSYSYFDLDHSVGISTPNTFELSQNFPNPFNPATQINFSIPQASDVKLIVYNSIGEEIVTLVNEYKQPGRYNVEFNGSNISSGIYYYKLTAGEYVSVKKMILMK
jgi:hypothetical protein